MKSEKLAEFKTHRFYKYLASLFIVAIATFIQRIFWPLVEPAPFIFYFPAIIFGTIYGDGMFAIILSMLCAQYYFITPFLSLAFIWPDDYIRQLVFFFSACTIRYFINKQIEAKLAAEDALELLQEEKDLREKFVSTLTHDLQTPLTAAKLSLQMLMKNPDAQNVGRNGERAIYNLSRIERMIRDLLDANKIRAGKKLPLKIIEMDICPVIKSTMSELCAVHGDRFHLKAPDAIIGFWCEDAIRRTTENLCSNAVKYGYETTPINISVEKSDHRIELKVHNQGDTISHQELELLFHPYERSKTHSKKMKKGWGLGLTLVKGLTEAQGGKVSVTSDQTGTTFTVCLPQDVRQFVEEK